METFQSEQINELAAAIVNAQLALIPASKEQVNPFFKSKYADLPAVWEAAEPFRQQGIAITQSPMDAPDECIVLDTQLSHVSGQWMRSRLKIRVAKNDPQGYGSALTYARRYALGCMTGIVTEEDDDGNAASEPSQKAQQFIQHKQTAQAKIAALRAEYDGSAGSYSQGTSPGGAASVSDALTPFMWKMGKYKGMPIDAVDGNYLSWAAQNISREDHQIAAQQELDRRHAQEIIDLTDEGGVPA